MTEFLKMLFELHFSYEDGHAHLSVGWFWVLLIVAIIWFS